MDSDNYSDPSSRPAPRRSSKRTRKSRPRRIVGIWARVALLAVFIGVLGVMAVRLVLKIARPYREAGAQTTQLRGTRGQVALLDTQNAALRRQIAYLKTGGGMVVEARKNGYVREGEVPFVVEGLMPTTSLSAAPSASKPAPPAAPARRSRAARLWHRLTGH